jgi:hypothetical protein
MKSLIPVLCSTFTESGFISSHSTLHRTFVNIPFFHGGRLYSERESQVALIEYIVLLIFSFEKVNFSDTHPSPPSPPLLSGCIQIARHTNILANYFEHYL